LSLASLSSLKFASYKMKKLAKDKVSNIFLSMF
jgi:hypothetical protein